MPRTTMGVYVVTWRIWLIHCLLIGPRCNSAGAQQVRPRSVRWLGRGRETRALKSDYAAGACIRLASSRRTSSRVTQKINELALAPSARSPRKGPLCVRASH